MQPNKENVAICVSFAPLKTLTVIFQVTPYFVMKNIEIKPMKIKTSKRATHARNALMLLQNVSARMWQHFLAFSSVVNHQDFFK